MLNITVKSVQATEFFSVAVGYLLFYMYGEHVLLYSGDTYVRVTHTVGKSSDMPITAKP